MERFFGVVNIPNVIWIDESGTIVRPAEPGWGGPEQYPEWLTKVIEDNAKQAAADGKDVAAALSAGQDRNSYADAVRDWAAHGAESRFAMSPDEVIAASQPRSLAQSEAAARFELGQRAWRAGHRDAAFAHWRETHRLDPGNWTYKRQAWSLVGNEAAGGGDFGRFMQVPTDDSWPFDGDFGADREQIEPGEYYPKTLDI
jgi:hypothetical protein